MKNEQVVYNQQVALTELGGGVSRKILAYNDQMMMVEVHFEKGGIGALGFSVNGEFDRQITPEMEAEGWTLPRAQFEGGFWYVTAEKTVGDAVYSVRMMIDGSKIFSLEISVNDLNAHFAAMVAEEVQG